MSEDENRKLAEWIGWHQSPSGRFWLNNKEEYTGYSIPGHTRSDTPAWTPDTSIEQAMMLLGKFPRWDLFKFKDGTKGCIVWDENDEVYESNCNHTTPESAIVGAILRSLED